MVFSPFIPGIETKPEYPLDRFLPPLPPGMIRQWVSGQIPRGSWILDPIGNSPQLVLDLARMGYLVLVTSNNPVNAFLIEMLAQSPDRASLEEALGILARTDFNGQPLEKFIRAFYTVPCTNCGHAMEVSSFLWQKEETSPFGFQGTCPNCQKSGEQALTPEAKASLPSLSSYSIYHARALESVVALDDPQRNQVETALNCYLPRAMVLLQTILLRLSKLPLSSKQVNLLQALLLSTFDSANSLWAYPPPPTRRRQLTIPAVFRENNIWQALERSVDLWSGKGTPVSCKQWPDYPPLSGGISMFKGRLRDLEPLAETDLVQAAVSILPRPNQAFWTLSAVWSGWLWGKAAVQPIKQALSRQRYDWNWHTNALRSSFQASRPYLSESKPFFMAIFENEHNFLSAALYAAKSAGLALQSFSLSGDNLAVQSCWKPGAFPLEQTEPSRFIDVGSSAAVDFLTSEAQPCEYEPLHAAILIALCREDLLGVPDGKKLDLPLTETYRQTDSILLDKARFTRFGGGSSSMDSGLYWLADPPPGIETLADRIEQKVIDLLHQPGDLSQAGIKEALYQVFPGLLTPSDQYINTCLESYAGLLPGEIPQWSLRANERYEKRQEDLEEIRAKCVSLGADLKFNVSKEGDTIKWLSGDPAHCYTIFIKLTAQLSSLHSDRSSTGKKVIILPGSRANLLAYKLKHDPYLNNLITSHFMVVKFRQLRAIYENPLITRELWDILIKEDPPELSAAQLALL